MHNSRSFAYTKYAGWLRRFWSKSFVAFETARNVDIDFD